MKHTQPTKNSEKNRNVKNTRVKIAEVNADDPVPIIPGEGNRNFDDPVIPVDDLPDKKKLN